MISSQHLFTMHGGLGMAKFNYTLDEHALIMHALRLGANAGATSKTVWEAPCVKPVKSRLKAHRLREQMGVCCYCQQWIQGQHSMTLDIEHILPKSIFKHCIFDLKNLAVSCRRCNFYKGDKLDFLHGDLLVIPKRDKSHLFKSSHYKFAHPNLSGIYEHLVIRKGQEGPVVIIHYRKLTEVGEFTFAYFRLKELEVNSMNEAQGIPPPKSDFMYALVQDVENGIYGAEKI